LDIGVVSSRGIDSQFDREICDLHTVFGIAADEFVEQSSVGTGWASENAYSTSRKGIGWLVAVISYLLFLNLSFAAALWRRLRILRPVTRRDRCSRFGRIIRFSLYPKAQQRMTALRSSGGRSWIALRAAAGNAAVALQPECIETRGDVLRRATNPALRSRMAIPPAARAGNLLAHKIDPETSG
jgi:hypothetical protein